MILNVRRDFVGVTASENPPEEGCCAKHCCAACCCCLLQCRTRALNSKFSMLRTPISHALRASRRAAVAAPPGLHVGGALAASTWTSGGNRDLPPGYTDGLMSSLLVLGAAAWGIAGFEYEALEKEYWAARPWSCEAVARVKALQHP
eukprot:jgi/Undpi1/4691/HiC_scaffold_18.g08044.m1